MVLVKKILKCLLCIFAISLISLLGKCHGPSFERLKFNSLYPRILYANFGSNRLGGFREEDYNFKMSSKYFLYNLPLKRDVVLHLNNLNPLTQGYVVPSLVEIGPVVLEKNLIYCDVLLLFHYQHSLSFEQTWIPFTQGCSVSKLAEIAWVGICGEEDFKMLSLYICYRIHLEKNPTEWIIFT